MFLDDTSTSTCSVRPWRRHRGCQLAENRDFACTFPRWPAFVVRVGAEHLRGKHSHRLPLWHSVVSRMISQRNIGSSQGMEISSLQRETRYVSRVMLMTIVVSSFSSSFLFFLRYSRILGEARLSRRCRRHEILPCCLILRRRVWMCIISKEFTIYTKWFSKRWFYFVRRLGWGNWRRNRWRIFFIHFLYVCICEVKRKLGVYFTFPFNSNSSIMVIELFPMTHKETCVHFLEYFPFLQRLRLSLILGRVEITVFIGNGKPGVGRFALRTSSTWTSAFHNDYYLALRYSRDFTFIAK